METLLNKPGKKLILLGNDAIVRGALEAGVQFVSTYPGTPASEIGNTFFRIAPKTGVIFEFSTNEKVAMEAGVGASFSGLKTLVAMKNFGLNVASDALLPFVYTGTKGPTVIIVADDPSCHSSAQSEENTRPFADLAHIPILEPADPQECKDFTKLGFQLSEKYKVPVLIRTTTRVSHQKMPVSLGQIPKTATFTGKFIKDTNRFVTMPPRVLEMKKELLEKIEKIRLVSETLVKKTSAKPSSIGIITSGVSYLYAMEALKELNLSLPVFKTEFFYPLPNKNIKAFIKNLKKVLILEELEPYIEKEVKILAKEVNCKLEVFGRNLIPEIGELKPGIVTQAIAKIANKKYTLPKQQLAGLKRLPQFCPGCPYWLVFGAVKKAVNEKEIIFGGDIGCYMLAGMPPIFAQDYLSCMGSSVGIAHGIKKSTKQKLITFIGDSTFFHSGIPAIINTVFNKSNPLIVIMDNQTTGMTGHQPHPGLMGVSIEKIVRACGVKHLKTIDPSNQVEFVQTVKEFLEKPEVSVIIASKPCIFVNKK